MIVSYKEALAEMEPKDRHNARIMHASICQIFSMTGGHPGDEGWEEVTRMMERWVDNADMPTKKAGWLARSILKDITDEY